MQVIEFKLSPHKAAIAMWEYQLQALKTVWNSGLALLIESDDRYWIERNGLKDICPGGKLRRKGNKVVKVKKANGKTEDKVTQWRTVLTGIQRPDKEMSIMEHEEVVGLIAGPYCCVRKLQGVKYITNSYLPEGEKEKPKNERIVSEFSKTNSISHYPWIDKNLVDSRHIGGVHKALKDAWKAYKEGIRKRPKFKGRKNNLKSLTNLSGSAKLILNPTGNNGYVKFPKINKPIPVKGLAKRYNPETMKIGQVKIVKRADEWYLQITNKTPKPKRVHKVTKATGFDPGVKKNITTSEGKTYHCKQSRRLSDRIMKLQRKASRQWLMSNGKGSKSHTRTQVEIARLKGKEARSRKAWAHKFTSRASSECAFAAIEDTQLKNMTRRPKPKEDGKGGYAPNGAAAKSGLNKAILRSSMGSVKRMLATKMEAAGRTCIKVPAFNTSATCNACGYVHTKEQKKQYRPKQDTFICQSCGHTENADVNAAKNILEKGLQIHSESVG